MARNPTRPRFEWLPGAAAEEGFEIAQRIFPHLERQEVLDRLVLVALSALRHGPWQPPALFGNDRNEWRLPANLRLGDEACPEPDRPNPLQHG